MVLREAMGMLKSVEPTGFLAFAPAFGVEARDAGGRALKGRLPIDIDWVGCHGVPYVSQSGRVTVKVDPCTWGEVR
jgi:hypothetical protein